MPRIASALPSDSDRGVDCARRGNFLGPKKRLGAEAGIRLVSSLAIAPWMVEGPSAEDLVRSVELMRRYVDLPLGFSDAASVALAERLKETTVASLDNHFRIVRPNHIDAFTVVP